MTNDRPLSMPVILGTTRKGRISEHAARLMVGQIENRTGISTELIDISDMPMPVDDAGDGIKDKVFSEKMVMADALVIVTPATGPGGIYVIALDGMHLTGIEIGVATGNVAWTFMPCRS